MVIRPRPALGNTWRGRTYPEAPSAWAASFVFEGAEHHYAFDRGVTIRSQRGFWLAIPTAAAVSKG